MFKAIDAFWESQWFHSYIPNLLIIAIYQLIVIKVYPIYFSGEKPIQATCELNTGTTIVGEEIQAILETCEGDGCSKITFDYGQSISQMKTLIDISISCHQTLSFKCFGSPLKIGSKNIGYWLDRQGELLLSFWNNINFYHNLSLFLPLWKVKFKFLVYNPRLLST